MLCSLLCTFHFIFTYKGIETASKKTICSKVTVNNKKKGKEEEETHNRPSKLNISAQFHGKNRFSGLQSSLLGVGVILVKSGVRKTN